MVSELFGFPGRPFKGDFLLEFYFFYGRNERYQMKKFLAVLLSLVMVLSLAACGGNDNSDAQEPAGGDSQEPADSGNEESSGTDALPGEGMKIALVCDKVGTQVFLTQMVDALNEAAEKYGFEPTVAECADTAAYEDNIRALVAEDYDMIIGGSWQASDALNKVATEYPDASKYVQIDTEIDNDNIKCISYREQEGAYLIGMIGAYTTDGESHTYGSVHANEGAGSWKWRWGFMQGVLSVDPDAQFIFNYTSSYTDPAKAKELAIQQYEQGCVFIQSAAAGGDSGTFEAAKEKGFYTSGQDVDLTDPNNPYIVSSQIKDTYQTVWNILDEYFSGNYSTENAVYGISDGTIGAVYITHDSPNPRSERLTDEEIDKIKAVAEQIRTGELDLTNMPTEDKVDISAARPCENGKSKQTGREKSSRLPLFFQRRGEAPCFWK